MITISGNPNAQKDYPAGQMLFLSSEIEEMDIDMDRKPFYDLEERKEPLFCVMPHKRASSFVAGLSRYIDNALEEMRAG